MFVFVMAGLALVLGGSIYIMFRTPTFRFFRWAETAGFGQLLQKIRADYFLGPHHSPEWFVYSLPEGLWAFAYATIISSMWIGRLSWVKYLWIASIPVLPLGYEILQLTGAIPGTFCLTDILSGLVGGSLGITLVYITKYIPVNETETF